MSECPFCQLNKLQIELENREAVAFFDAYPVSDGHLLIVPRRHVPDWFSASPQEHQALLELVEQGKQLLDQRFAPDGYNIGINVGEAAGQTVPHLHVHLIPRNRRDVDDPTGGVRFVIPEKGNYKRPGHIPRLSAPTGHPSRPLATGGRKDPFLAHLKPLFARSTEIWILAAFVQSSGVERLRDLLDAALDRGAHVRLLTGDYLHLTQARALRGLLDLQTGESLEDEDPEDERNPSERRLEVRVVEAERLKPRASTFHPKSWIFLSPKRASAFVGSSNVSWAALTHGLEWNLRLDRERDPQTFSDILGAFEETWSQGTQLTPEWLEGYADRAAAVARDLPAWDVEEEGFSPPRPRDVQQQALERLRNARTLEHRKRAVVVLATGLGKTWLAAFDVEQFAEELGRSPRVLLLAHRVELLRQAARTFRRLFPDRRFGWHVGASNDLTGDVVFASVMKLGRSYQGRARHLEELDPRAFDYVVVDEVHHAEAATYRRILDRLEPSFLLGLTATPERADAGDVLGLFDDFLAYEAGVAEGIAGGHLVPFHYYGLKDVVDYAPIPWRNRRFDPGELERAVQTEARMQRLWEGWEEHPGTRTLVFCCSIPHADFVKGWLIERGVSARAAHSGPSADDRVEALDSLAAGSVQAVCAVDLLNEGIDLPAIDRVVMLRPTESPVIFLQQLGRGLRTSEGKDALTVIDFVGNHRVFLERVRTLLQLAGNDAPSLREFLRTAKPLELPSGCGVDVELEAVDLLRKLLPAGSRQRLVQAYRDLRESRGERPTIGELYRLGQNPGVLKAFDGWFEFVEDEGDLAEGEANALSLAKDFLSAVERREAVNKCFKLVTLQAMLEADAIWDGMRVSDLAARSLEILRRSPELAADAKNKELGPLESVQPDAWAAYWRKWPLAHWAGEGRSKPSRAWFRLKDDRFEPRLTVPDDERAALSGMLREIVDYRLARYRRSRAASPSEGASQFECKLITNSSGNPIIKLPSRRKLPGLPSGEVDVRLQDGSVWQFRFMKEFCNVARPVGKQRNELPDLLRRWFGPEAGLAGTAFYVRFERTPDGWWVVPANKPAGKVISFPERGKLVAFPTLKAAAGWPGEAGVFGEGIEAEEVVLPGKYDREKSFAVRASGMSMAGVRSEIRDGDWLVMRWARNAGLSEVLNRVALVARGDAEGGRTFHLKRVKRGGKGLELYSDNPEFPPMPASESDQVVALLTQSIRPESLGPEVGTVLEDLLAAFGLTASPSLGASRVDGHLFLLLEGKKSLLSPTQALHPSGARKPGETAFVLGRGSSQDPWRYLGVGRWSDPDHAWQIPEADFAAWRALGHGRGASRSLPAEPAEEAKRVLARLLAPELPRWVEARGKRCRIVGRSTKGGIRIDGGSGGFKERTVSPLDLGWVLLARSTAESAGAVDEALVNRLRYLNGTPKGSTRWVDSKWALVLTEPRASQLSEESD